MKKYRKIPVVIEAIRLNTMNERYIAELIGAELSIGGITICTLDGDAKALYGDFIIKESNGEFYPCKSEDFKKTYEKIEE